VRAPARAAVSEARPRRAVEHVDACTDSRWAQLACHAGAGLFTSPPWLRAICETYGFTAEARIILDSGTPAGGVVSINVEDHRGRRRVSVPFCDRADPVAPDLDCWNLLRAGLVADGVPYTLRCLDKTVPARDVALRRTREAAWHGTTTTEPHDDTFARLHPTARRNVRAAERCGVEVCASSDLDAVHRFFDLHLHLRKRKYRLLAQPREFFERVWREFAADDAAVTMLAHLDGRVVAGALFLVWGDVLYYKFGASLQEHLLARPNDALFWAAMRWAHDRGLRLVDWGLSELDQPGLVGYKRKWADAEGRIVTKTSAPDRPSPQQPFSQTLGALTALLTEEDVPQHVTERAGALLYRYFC